MSYLLLDEAQLWERKEMVAEHFIGEALSRVRMHHYSMERGASVPLRDSLEVFLAG
jgi:hypothetical protein